MDGPTISYGNKMRATKKTSKRKSFLLPKIKRYNEVQECLDLTVLFRLAFFAIETQAHGLKKEVNQGNVK